MPFTKPIPLGTRNITYNGIEDEWAILKEASLQFNSLGDLLRTLVLEGAKVRLPEVAAEIHAARRKYGRHVAATALLAVGLLSIGQSWFERTDLRRAKGKAPIAKLVKVKRATGRTDKTEGEA